MAEVVSREGLCGRLWGEVRGIAAALAGCLGEMHEAGLVHGVRLPG